MAIPTDGRTARGDAPSTRSSAVAADAQRYAPRTELWLELAPFPLADLWWTVLVPSPPVELFPVFAQFQTYGAMAPVLSSGDLLFMTNYPLLLNAEIPHFAVVQYLSRACADAEFIIAYIGSLVSVFFLMVAQTGLLGPGDM